MQNDINKGDRLVKRRSILKALALAPVACIAFAQAAKKEVKRIKAMNEQASSKDIATLPCSNGRTLIIKGIPKESLFTSEHAKALSNRLAKR